jgi:hypothetical protein
MRTYVAEINGEPVMAFRAEDHDGAFERLNGGIKTTLLERERADGGMLWDGQSEIVVRAAMVSEERRWREEMGGKEMDKRWLEDGDDPYALTLFLIPVVEPLSEAEAEEMERDYAESCQKLRKACQKADLVVAEWDDGKLILKGAELLHDGQGHNLASVGTEPTDGVDELLHDMTDTITGKKFRTALLECQDRDGALALKQIVDEWRLAQ